VTLSLALTLMQAPVMGGMHTHTHISRQTHTYAHKHIQRK